MADNIEQQAAGTIAFWADVHHRDPQRAAATAARNLNSDGLLAPELPEPDVALRFGGHTWYLTGPIGDVRSSSNGKITAFGMGLQGAFRMILTPDEAERIARTFLAAAQSAREAESNAMDDM